jgi:lipopolysaccharide export system permease protein
MMRLLDRYVLSVFVPALLVFTAVFVVLFIAVDFASKLPKFLDLRSVGFLSFAGHYYLLRVPMVLMFILPMVLLFSTIFTVVKLSRSNEILPIAASGTSLRRMALPFLGAGVLGTAAMASLDEFVLARLGEQIARTEEVLASKELDWRVSGWDGRTRVAAESYNVLTRTLNRVRITCLDDQALTREVVVSERAVWDERRGRWVAFEGTVERPFELLEVEGEKPRPWKRAIPPEGHVVDSAFSPKQLRKSGLSFTDTFAPLRDLLEKARQSPHDPTEQMKVHVRLAFPWTPVLLILIGLPSVVAAHSRSFVKDLSFSFVLGLAYYAVFFTGLYLGNRGNLPALLAAWGPNALFALVGLISFARMRT